MTSERTCPFYGLALNVDTFSATHDGKGCGAGPKFPCSGMPCVMELQGKPPDWKACPFPKDTPQLAELLRIATVIPPHGEGAGIPVLTRTVRPKWSREGTEEPDASGAVWFADWYLRYGGAA